MTAITARINSTTSDLAFMRGLLMGIVAAAILAIAVVAAIVFVPTAMPAQAPSLHRPSPVQFYKKLPFIGTCGV
jgi:hypothetical protein